MNAWLESTCGSELWDNNQTVYSDYPDFTFCFQQTVLIWIPCFILWIIAPIWVYMLKRRLILNTKISWVFYFKIEGVARTTIYHTIERIQLEESIKDNKKTGRPTSWTAAR